MQIVGIRDTVLEEGNLGTETEDSGIWNSKKL